jgi:hypothetical protein
MALVSMRADEVDRRLENRAAIIDEYQPSFKLDQPESPGPPKPASAGRVVLHFSRPKLKGSVEVLLFELRLRNALDPERIGKLISGTHDWSLAQFQELGTKSPEALARVAMFYRDKIAA